MQTDWRSIYILTIVMFLGSFKMAAMSSGLWAYMKVLDPDITETFLGIMNSISNTTNLLFSFIAGVICDKLGNTKLCIVVGKGLWIFAVLAYLLVEKLPKHTRYGFLFMEVCFGLSMGLMSTSRTTVSMNSSEADRPRAFAVMSLAISIGLGLGPAVIVPMTLLPYPGFEMPFGVHLNLYTAPMYFVLLTVIISIVLLVVWFDGRMHVKDYPKKIPDIKSEGRFKWNFETSYDKFAVFICCLTRVVQSSSMLFLMNVGGPYMMTIFGWSSKDLLQYNSIVHTAIGVVSGCVCALYIFNIAQKYLSDRRAIVISMALKLVYYLLTYPYPFLTSRIPYEIKEENGTIVQDGCSDRLEWCETTPQINLWVYTAASVLCFGVGMPLIMLNLDVLYSKVLGHIKQGKMQGMFLLSGEVLTVFGPIIFTSIYEATGPVYIWQFNIVTITGVLILWIVYYERMISATRREQGKAISFPETIAVLEGL
ncbi:unnamed protein product [Bursaphelenchus xylophilus]|uniref:(pine wood nematode) hypothetical protein n=1 Tax=Bursaphelenchus xylophilus TaxID=6326 RepID=A0A1I7RMM5_BURXY|nr:unnamed protein product [Bursaphelenchus xylophilus]CAG9125668.1 unnamed protein product [Bursaphelenchus xylophilus]